MTIQNQYDTTHLNYLELIHDLQVDGVTYSSVAPAVTAHSGGGQTSAVPLLATFNNITTVANQADSVMLLPSVVGLTQIVSNQGANAVQVFGTSPDTINGVATGTGVSVPVGAIVTFTVAVAGNWLQSNVDLGAIVVTSVNGLTITTSTGTLTIPNGVVLTGPAASGTVATLAGTQTLTNKTLVDVINNDTVTNTASLNIASTTTLATVPGLSVALTAAGTYAITGKLPVSGVTGSNGIKVALVGTNSLSVTSMTVDGWVYSGTTLESVTNANTLAVDMGSANTCTILKFDGTIVVNAAGTLNLQAAQHSSTSLTTTIGAGGFMSLTRIS